MPPAVLTGPVGQGEPFQEGSLPRDEIIPQIFPILLRGQIIDDGDLPFQGQRVGDDEGENQGKGWIRPEVNNRPSSSGLPFHGVREIGIQDHQLFRRREMEAYLRRGKGHLPGKDSQYHFTATKEGAFLQQDLRGGGSSVEMRSV